MTVLFYNCRGLGAGGRKLQILELVQQKRVEIICLQETITSNLSRRAMRALGVTFNMFGMLRMLMVTPVACLLR